MQWPAQGFEPHQSVHLSRSTSDRFLYEFLFCFRVLRLCRAFMRAALDYGRGPRGYSPGRSVESVDNGVRNQAFFAASTKRLVYAAAASNLKSASSGFTDASALAAVSTHPPGTGRQSTWPGDCAGSIRRRASDCRGRRLGTDFMSSSGVIAAMV